MKNLNETIARLFELDERRTQGDQWQWYGNGHVNELYLATVDHGRRFVMQFKRWGMRGAQPFFQPKPKGGMVPASELVRFEVGNRDVVGMTAARNDTSVYRLNIVGVECADAQLMAEIPTMMQVIREQQEVIAEKDKQRSAAIRGIKFCMENIAHTRPDTPYMRDMIHTLHSQLEQTLTAIEAGKE